MQDINPVTSSQFLASGQEPLRKFEIFYCGCWVDLTNFGGKNYLKSISVSTAGADMSPNPIAGSWSAVIFNKNGMFDPDETTYAPYNEYFKIGVRIKIQIGARYGGVDYYWRRIYGFMDLPKFSIDNCEITLKGLDNMQFLSDTKLRMPDNYWGADVTKTTIASTETLGVEIYAEADAMDTLLEANNVINWVTTNCAFTSFAEVGGGSTWVGKMVLSANFGYVINEDIGNVTEGKKYKFIFKYWRDTFLGADGLIVSLSKTGTTEQMLVTEELIELGIWVEKTYYFIATETTAVRMKVRGGVNLSEWWIDQISLKEVTGSTNAGYSLPAACNGPYYATIDAAPFYYRDEGKGWWYDKDSKVFYIENDREVEAGLDLVISYFTDQIPEEVVADLLVLAGLYDTQAEALADMIYTATGITIEQVWFETGITVTNAIKMLCERCNYRFYFNYSGRPVFKPTPSSDITVGSLNYDNLAGSFLEGEEITGGTSGSIGTVKSDDGSTLELIDCVGCFNDDEQITGATSAATADVNHPDGAVGVDEHVENGAFVHDVDPPNDWTAGLSAALTTEGAGKVGNCLMITENGEANPFARRDFTVIPGNNYRFNGYVKAGTEATYKAAIYDVTNAGFIWYPDDEEETAGDWSTNFTHDYEAPEGCTTARIVLYQRCAALAGTTIYFDEITHYDLEGADFTFLESKIKSLRDHEDRNEIRNRIVIEGVKEAQPIGPEETMPSDLRGEASEVASINKYGEHTMLIKNQLFRDQTTIDAYCAIYLAAFKDPKWYTNFDSPFNPAPLVKGDTAKWRKKYEAGDTAINQRGIIRDIKIKNDVVSYVIEKV